MLQDQNTDKSPKLCIILPFTVTFYLRFASSASTRKEKFARKHGKICDWYIHIHRFVHECIRTYVHTHIYIHIYVSTYIHTYIHTYIYTYVGTYMHTYIYIYIYTYKHTYITYTRFYNYDIEQKDSSRKASDFNLEMPSPNLGRDTAYPNSGCAILSVPWGKFMDSEAINPQVHPFIFFLIIIHWSSKCSTAYNLTPSIPMAEPSKV